MTPRVDLRRRVARAALAVAVLAFAWSLLLAATGGFDASIGGLTIRSHNWTRTAIAGCAAFAVFVSARGPRVVWTALSWFARRSDAWLTRRALPYRSLAFLLAAGVLVWGVYRSTGVAGGSDSYGYISQSDLWLHGLPIVRQPWAASVPWPNAGWTFAPLGYRPTPDGLAIVPTYAVGLPLLMAAVKAVAGHAAVFWLAPTAGALLVLIAYAVGRRLDSPAAGLIAAWLMATNATLIGELPSPMSDVIAAAGLAGACYLLLAANRAQTIAAGLAAALAVVVRPNLAGTVLALALWVAARRPAGAAWQPRQLLHAAALLIAASPGFAIPALANWRLFGSPFVSGYGDLASIYDWSNVLPNLQQYPRLLVRSWSLPALAGLALLVVPARRLWPRVAEQSMLLGVRLFVLSIVAQYLAYEFASGEGYLRFLLPCWPFAMAAAARLLLAVARPGWALAIAAVALVAHGAVSAAYAGRDDHLSERKYPGAAAIVRARTEPASVIYADQHSGSVRYYGGRLTLRWDLLDPAWLDRSIDWFAQRGIHVYAVLDDWEVTRFRKRFVGQRRVAQIDRPLAIYRGAVVTHVYDLGRPIETLPPIEQVIDRFDGPRFPRPVAPSEPVLK